MAATTTTRRSGWTPSSSVCGGGIMGKRGGACLGLWSILRGLTFFQWIHRFVRINTRTRQELAQHALRGLGVLPRAAPARQSVHLVEEDDGGR